MQTAIADNYVGLPLYRRHAAPEEFPMRIDFQR
jgi:hypothetical protein